MTVAIRGVEPSEYIAHSTHRGERVWSESNCYVDLWTELLHGNGYEPLACLPFTIGTDLEGDQWTFFKFPLADLYQLYGIDVFELNVWRPLVVHVEEQLALGRPVIAEMDSFYLPDTSGTSYRTGHVKTSIGIQMLDREARRLGYYHGIGYHELGGDDFDGVFRIGSRLADPEFLPPYVEVAKLDARTPLEGDRLVSGSIELLREHLRRRPRANPFRRYQPRFDADLRWLESESLSTFHGYAFATLRQAGASFELAADYLDWLTAKGEAGLDVATTDFRQVAEMAKGLQFKTARLANNRKPFDPAPFLDGMAEAWDRGMRALVDRYRP